MRLPLVRQSRQVIHAHSIQLRQAHHYPQGDFSFSGFVAGIGTCSHQDVFGHLALAEAFFFPKLSDSFVQRNLSFQVFWKPSASRILYFPSEIYNRIRYQIR